MKNIKSHGILMEFQEARELVSRRKKPSRSQRLEYSFRLLGENENKVECVRVENSKDHMHFLDSELFSSKFIRSLARQFSASSVNFNTPEHRAQDHGNT